MYLFYNYSKFLRCKLPFYENDTYEIQNDHHQKLIDTFIPSSSKSLKTKYNQCELKIGPSITNSSDLFTEDYLNTITNQNYTLEKCNEWVYSKEYFESTIISDVIKFFTN